MGGTSSPGRRRKPEIVVEALLERMKSGALPIGSRLPSERDLAVDHGVSRNAVREALAVLQLSGHVETRLGDGSYVVEPSPVEERAGNSLVAGTGIAESLQAREALELASALMAMRKATRSDLLKVDAIIAEMEEHLEHDDFEAYLRATLDLHMAIAAASRTPLLVKLVTELTEKHSADQWVLHARYTPEIGAYSLDVHRALAQAIRNKDIAAIYEATCRHYEEYPVLKADARSKDAQGR